MNPEKENAPAGNRGAKSNQAAEQNTTSSDYVTILTVQRPEGPANKRVTLEAGKPVKSAAPGIVAAWAATRHVPDADSLADVLRAIGKDPRRVLICGYVPGTEDGTPYRMFSQGQLIKEGVTGDMTGWHELDDGRRYIARLGTNLSQSSWQLFDRDITPDMPEHLAAMDYDQWLAAMEAMVPGFTAAGRVVVPSTTARVTVDGVPMESAGVHCFVQGQQADAWQLFGANLLLRSFLKKYSYGFMRPKYSKDTGDVMAHVPWSIFDPTTFSPERLVYDGCPYVEPDKGLAVLDPVVDSYPGNRLDNTANALRDSESIEAKQATGCALEVVSRTVSRLGADGRVSSVDVTVPMTIDTETLKPETVFEVKINGHTPESMTLREFAASDLDKVRCQTPFRDSTSWNGYLARHDGGDAFHFDNGARIKYTCNDPYVMFDGIEPEQSPGEKLNQVDTESASYRQGISSTEPPTTPHGAPLDIFTEMEAEPPAWNPEHYPRLIAEYSQDLANRMGVDPAIACWNMVGMLAAALPDFVTIRVKEHDTWTESARLWIAISGLPSVKKSPAQSELRKPIDKLQKKWVQDYDFHKSLFDQNMKVYTAKEKEYIKKRAKGEEMDAPVKPNPPIFRRLAITDSTVEGVTRVAKDNPAGLLSLQDELSGWFGSMDAYRGNGINKDRPDWLKLFNGGPHIIDRAQSHTFIDNWSCSIVGGIQPDPLRKIAATLDDDGLIQRFIFIIARPAKRDSDALSDGKLADEYAALIKKFTGLRNDRECVLSPTAQSVLTNARYTIQAEGLSPLYDTRLQTAFQKGEGILARLVLLYHCIESDSDTIELETVQRAWSMYWGYIRPSLIHFHTHSLGLHGDTADAALIANLILARGCNEITARTIVREIRRFRKAKPHEIASVMELLDLANWCHPVMEKAGKYPRKWMVNPEAHNLFKDRAEGERARRAAVTEDMLARGLTVGGVKR